MNIIEWLKDKLGLFDDDDDYEFDYMVKEGEDVESMAEVLRKQTPLRRDLNVHNYLERERYVRSICEKMASGSGDVDGKKSEYQKVSDRLQDLEEIEALPSQNRAELRSIANDILSLEAEEAKYKRPQSKISEVQYRDMERMEDEIPEILKKLEESEKYQATVKRDMNLLEGEKAALAYQRKEDKARLANSKALFVVCVFAAAMAYIVIIALNVTMRVSITLPIIVVSAILAMCLTGIFVSFRNSREDYLKASRQINRSITLQNTAKIKYVNVTNLIDYYYSKYKINSSHELYYMYEKFIEERNARHHSENTAIKFEQLRMQLFNCLKRFRIKDPSNWVYQPSVLVYDKDMAAMRHELVVQRQRLRKGIDFEVYDLENGKKEIQDLILQYPQYSKEILAIVEQYD